MAGLLYNPLFNASMGLLAAGGPSRFPVGFGQALNQGLLQAQGADVAGQELGFRGREADQRDQLFALKQQAIAQEQEQAVRQRAAMEQLRAQMTPEMQNLMALDPKLAAQAWAQKQGLLTQQTTPSDLGKRLEEYQSLPEGDPRRRHYEQYFSGLGKPTTSITNIAGGGLDLDMDTKPGQRIADILRLQTAIDRMPEGSAARDAAEKELATMLSEQEAPSRTAGEQVNERTRRASIVSNKINDALALINSGTTGLFGYVTGGIPGSQAYDLKSTIETIKANVGFEELGRIKAQSATGSALGSISERELSRLEAVAGNLDHAQSKELLTKNLKELQQQVEESWSNVIRAYYEEFGKLPDNAQEYSERFGVDLNAITNQQSGQSRPHGVIDLTGLQ